MIEYTFDSPKRSYKLWLGRDLLGDLQLIRRWQGKGSRRGGQKIDILQSEEAGRAKIRAIVRLRLRHGYQITCQLEN